MTKMVTAAALGLLATTALVRNTPTPPGPDEAERRLPMVGDRATRFAGFTPDSYSAEARTVEAVLSSGAPVRRWCFTEELAIDDGAVDLTRVTNGLVSLLDTHNQYEIDAVLGTVSSVRIESGQLIGLLHFADTDRGREAEARVSRGELRGVSIGYRVTKWEITSVEDDHETWRATGWELLEVSLVSVPADAAAGVRSAPGSIPGSNEEDDDMRRNLPGGAAAPATPAAATPAPAPAATETRSEPSAPPAPVQQPAPAQRSHAVLTASAGALLTDLARDYGEATQTRLRQLIEQNENDEISPEQVRSQFMAACGDAQRARTIGVVPGAPRDQNGSDQLQARAAATTNAILNMVNPSRYAIDDNSRSFRGQSLRTLARGHLEAMGVNTRGMSDIEVAQGVFQRSAGMHTTSDFPHILGSVVRRTLRDAYALAPRTYQAWSRRVTAPDFREIKRVALSDAPELKKVEEHGEYTYGTLGESAETFRVAKYGRIIAVTWETIVNDDLDALSRIPAAFGQSAAQKESDIVYDLLLDNGNMSDGYALFSSDHGNLAGSGGAISIATLSAARAAMRKQTSPQGNAMDVTPGILLVGPDKELEAYQYTSANYVPVSNGTINPEFNRNLKVVVDPRITGNQWYLLVDPSASAVDTVEYAYLAGEEGVMIEERRGFEVDGLEIKARLVFGAGAIEHRGVYKNAGA
jgi:HK97 family phage prohead protease